jgi:hypothetical protein
MRQSLIASFLALVFATCTPHPVTADFVPTHLLLARAYVGEAGWHSRRDHAAIFHAVRNRAHMRGVTFREQLLAYAKAIDGRDWVAGLQENGSLGTSWPAHYARAVYRPLWNRVLVEAATDLVFTPQNPCDGLPEHWAGMRIRADRLRASRAVQDGRWRALSCGGTRNRFFAVRGRAGRLDAVAVGGAHIL